MNVLDIAKASPVGNEEVESVYIQIETEKTPPSTGTGWQENYENFYTKQAESLANALCSSLPGGTLDRLTGTLLKRRGCMLMVPFPRVKP